MHSMDAHGGRPSSPAERDHLQHRVQLAVDDCPPRGRPLLRRLSVASLVTAAALVAATVFSSTFRRHVATTSLDEIVSDSKGTREEEPSTPDLFLGTTFEMFDGTYVFKRTYASANADADGMFMVDALGFLMNINTTVRCSPDTPGFELNESACAVRTGVLSETTPEFHFYESFVTPEVRDQIGCQVRPKTSFSHIHAPQQPTSRAR